MYVDEQGIYQNALYAYMWAGVALHLGNDQASDLFAQMQSVLSAEQLTQADELVKICIANEYKNCDTIASPSSE